MKHKSAGAMVKADGDRGEVEALVAVFGNVDKAGDRIVKGAFALTILEWAVSGDPVPVIWSHDWSDPGSHIGVVESMQETEKGLLVRYRLDIETNPKAAQVFKQLQRRSIREHSFGYTVRKERRAADGANELLDVSLIEIGPTLRGMNPATELLATKATARDEDRGLIERVNAACRAAGVACDVKANMSEVDQVRARIAAMQDDLRFRIADMKTDRRLRSDELIAKVKRMCAEAGIVIVDPVAERRRAREMERLRWRMANQWCPFPDAS